MTDPVIPPAAIEAAAKVAYGEIHEVNRTRILAEFEAVLAAALPHLRPLFEVATQVGLELGRQEAAEEIAVALDERAEAWSTPSKPPKEWDSHHLVVRNASEVASKAAAKIAREVATRTADARIDPSGHTDLPPTPDAGSKRLPEEGDEWCCGTCQRIAWEANPMSREEQSAGETP